MGFLFVDSGGLRRRRAMLEETAVELAASRNEAGGILASVGRTSDVLTPVEASIEFAEGWITRLGDYITEAELGSWWGAARPWLDRIGWDSGALQDALYRRYVGAAVEAMRAGWSPADAGLGAAFFPGWYRARQDELRAMREELRRLVVDYYINRGGDRGRIDELVAGIKALEAAQVSLDEVRRHIYETPLLSDSRQRDLVYGSLLAAEYVAYAHAGDQAWREILEDRATMLEKGLSTIATELAGLASRPDVAVAFFETLGATESARLVVVLSEYVQFRADADDIEVHNPAGLVRTFSEAFGRASGRISFSGAELVTAWHDSIPQYLGVPPAPPVTELFHFGHWDEEFLVSAYDTAEALFDGIGPLPADNFGITADGSMGDPRAVLLRAIAAHPGIDITAFLSDERIAEMLDDSHRDDGAAAGAVLARVGRLPAGAADARDAVARVISQIADGGGRLQDLTALGAAAMVDNRIEMFLPSGRFNPETGEFDLPLDTQLIRFDLGRPSYDVSELDRVKFLEVVMRSGHAQLVLLDSLARTLHGLVSVHASSPRAIAGVSDELGLLVGRFVDISGAVSVQAGRDRDEANALSRRVLAAVIGVAASAATAAVLPAGLGWQVGGHLIGAGGGLTIAAGLEAVFPNDNELEAWAGRFQVVVDADAERQFRILVLAALYEADPGLFDVARIPDGLITDGALVLPAEGSAEVKMWTDWWESNPFLGADAFEMAALATSDFFARRALASSEDFGAELPFTDR